MTNLTQYPVENEHLDEDKHAQNNDYTHNPLCPHKFITGEEIAKKLHSFDNYLQHMQAYPNGNDSTYAILAAFRMQFCDYYFKDKDYKQWESNSE